MRPYTISRHLSICEKREERINGVVGERPSVRGKTGRTRWIVEKHVRQQRPCHPVCFLRRIPTRVLQRVREDGDETGIVRRLPGEIGISLRARKEDSLRGPRATVRLDPPPARLQL